MDNLQIQTQDKQTRNRIVFVLLALYLILNFLWRLLIPAREWESLLAVLLTIVLDFVMMFGLFIMWSQISRELPPEQRAWQKGKIVFVIALTAGLGLITLRFFHGANGWWTGHLIYTLR